MAAMQRAGGGRGVRRSVLLALALIAAALVVPSTVAAEEDDGRPIGSLLPCNRPVNPPRCTSVGNDVWHFVYIDPSMPPRIAAALRRTVRRDYDATYLYVRIQPRITAATDVIALAADHGENGAAGWVYCPPDAPQGRTLQGDRWCQRQELHFNLNPRYAAYFADRASRRYMACHEIGHTVGLLHWGNPPLSDPPTAATCLNPDNPDGPTHLHALDRAHISEYYIAARSGTRVVRPFERDVDGGSGDFSAVVRSGPLSHW
jgi:hypothetical protein